MTMDPMLYPILMQLVGLLTSRCCRGFATTHIHQAVPHFVQLHRCLARDLRDRFAAPTVPAQSRSNLPSHFPNTHFHRCAQVPIPVPNVPVQFLSPLQKPLFVDAHAAPAVGDAKVAPLL